MTPGLQLTLDVQAAAKSKQAHIGIAAYHKAIAEGTHISPDLYSTLLYLCAGCDDWDLPLREQLIETSPLVNDIMRMAETSAATETATSSEAMNHANGSTRGPNQNGSVSHASQHSIGDSQIVSETNGSSTVATTGGSSACIASSIATLPAQSLSSSSTADNEAAVTSTSGRDTPEMSTAELCEAGRSIFEHMQVSEQVRLPVCARNCYVSTHLAGPFICALACKSHAGNSDDSSPQFQLCKRGSMWQ